MANNKEEEISCKMLNYNKSLDYEANLRNIAFANSVNKQFEEVYNKHLQTIKELEKRRKQALNKLEVTNKLLDETNKSKQSSVNKIHRRSSDESSNEVIARLFV